MDQELKQRLIGASVIIALAVIFIPMLFDNEVDKSADKKIDIVIPESGSHQLTVKTFSLDEEQQSNEPTEVKVPESELSLADDGIVSHNNLSGNGLIETSETVATRDIPQEQDNQDNTVTVAQTEQTNTSADSSLVEEKQVDHSQQADQTSANSTTVKSEQSVAADEQNIFRVKLGSFSQAANAQQVKNKLAQQGIGSLVELAPDKALYRVWSDSLYQDKDRAEDYVAAVNKLKLNIGTPKIITVSEAEIKASADRGQLGWVVQLGSFAAKNNALDLRNKLKLAGFTAFVDQIKNNQGESRYRLRVGPFIDRDQASQVKQQITDKLKLNGLVKTHELAHLVD
ncbi:MAG: SPOR domain-containing protein [Proteobacteria bacterium]|nr:MAG: SPOR domain-containing protein [Pseudomonadota bacterium]